VQSGAITWTGEIPAESVVFLHLSDGHDEIPVAPCHHWYVHPQAHYWFFDATAAPMPISTAHLIARLGMGIETSAVAQ